ncbi:MAG TPA: endopeptidase La [Bacteroidota bacterium]|nr:endopeptidase La [Bacteroidota bacterium]
MAKKEEIKYHDRSDVSVADVPGKLPVIPLRDVVVFPSMVYPVLIGRDSSLRAASHAWEQHKFVFLATQKNAAVEDPGPDQLHSHGSVAKIVQIVKLPNGLMKVLVDGIFRSSANSFVYNGQFLEADVEVTGHAFEMTQEIDALGRHTAALFAEYVHLNRNLPGEVLLSYEKIADPSRRLYFIAANLTVGVEVRQKILQYPGVRDQLFELAKILTTELDVLRIEKDIDTKVHDSIQKAQKKFLLQEQIRVLQDELGADDVLSPELEKLKKQIQAAHLPAVVKEKAMEEFAKLRKTPSQSPEFGVGRNYLDWMVNVPWYRRTKDNLDVRHVETILNEDHFGLEKPKQRILEHIAVLNLVKEMKGQILCFVGPPGVGKTSLGKSIARALGRKFVRISLGGVRDEAEIHGHRRTYIGSMPGKLIQSMKRAGVVNPVILMDEVDKMSMDFRGDPASALLEVLDPEQNVSFNDHYLDVDYDLSRVMFITTANVRYNIPLPLQDRMEIIELPGYLDFDKTEIAKRHIIPKQLAEHGLKPSDVGITDEAIIRIIREYTREAGVRNLEREIASVCRKVAKEIVVGWRKNGKGAKGAKGARGSKNPGDKKVAVDPKKIETYLGVPRFRSRIAETRRRVGSVTGLAWTSVGGDILSVDVTIMDGPEKLTLTGQLGEVMKESAQAALSYIRSNAKPLGVPVHFSSKKEIHIHLPEGAIPKDGPSAGITMAMAMISAASNRPARTDVAMTGEITLRGNVLAIGGLNEKLLAARRNGIRTILIPKENEKDLPEIPARVKEGLKIVPVEKIEDAIPWVFGK